MADSPAAPTDTFLEQLRTALLAAEVDWATARAVVALSGGLDSTVLLHALVALGECRAAALHVDHGIHPDASAWAAHCGALAGSLGVPFACARIEVERRPGTSLEAEARDARYRAFAEHLEPQDVLVTAHHANDQLETVLHRIVRGTGVRGLAAVHTAGVLGPGRLLRPLLERSRDEIRAYAVAHGLRWLEDPSNRDTALDRNYLRAEVVPALEARWPAAPRLASRLARRMAEAEELLVALAALDLADVAELDRVPLAVLAPLSEARRANSLRHAIRTLGLPVPDARQLAEIVAGLQPRPDAETCVSWPGGEARIHRGALYLMVPLPPAQPGPRPVLTPDAAWSGWAGRLELAAVDGRGIPDGWARDGLAVRFRAGGERVRPPGAEHHKTLKHWFQEAGVVPWMRARVPLLYHADQLVAIGETVVGDLPDAGMRGWQPRWTGHPRLR